MADVPTTNVMSAVITTAAVTFLTGFVLGVYSIRGYLITPDFAEERRKNLATEVESEEEDVDENDTILDHAPNWANGEEADRRDGLRARKEKGAGAGAGPGAGAGTSSAAAAAASVAAPTNLNEECKLVLVVRTDLGMTKGLSTAPSTACDVSLSNLSLTLRSSTLGKIAAQCSHATLACYKTLLRASQRDPSSPEARLLKQWERRGQAKIAVQIKSQDELMELMGKARSLGVTAEVIQDAGRTQIEAGSLTVLGVGPAPKSLVDKVTGHLKLL